MIIIIIISYFLKALLCPRLNWVNYYKLEKPISIRDSYTRPQAINQARWPDFYKYSRLPVTRWDKLSLNFESQFRV